MSYMQINTNEIQRQFKNLSDTNSEYYDIRTGFDENITQMSNVWITGVSQSYYNTYMNQRSKMDGLIGNGDDISALLSFLRSEYSTLGTSIYFNEYNVSRLYSVLNNYINKIQTLINTYGSVDTSEMQGDEIGIISRQCSHYRQELASLKSIKSKLESTIRFINDTESAVRRKINGIVITKVGLMEVSVDTALGSTDYNIDYMNVYNDNMKCLHKDELGCIEKVNNVKYYLVDGYSTKNTSDIQEKLRQLVDGMKMEAINHENDTLFVDREVSKILAVEQENSASFNAMDVEDKVKTV